MGCASIYLPVKWQWSIIFRWFLSLASLRVSFFYKCNILLHLSVILVLFLLMEHFPLSKIDYICWILSQINTKRFYTIFSNVQTMLIFYIIKHPYSWHWIFTRNMFPYFFVEYFSVFFLQFSIILIKDSRPA